MSLHVAHVAGDTRHVVIPPRHTACCLFHIMSREAFSTLLQRHIIACCYVTLREYIRRYCSAPCHYTRRHARRYDEVQTTSTLALHQPSSFLLSTHPRRPRRPLVRLPCIMAAFSSADLPASPCRCPCCFVVYVERRSESHE